MQLRSGWRHCLSSTYGTWLPGDPRGFRTRGHREHVEGDYKSPPKQDYSMRHEAATDRLKQPPVALSPEAQEAAVRGIVHALVQVHELEILAVAVGSMHMHLLGRFPAGQKPTPSRRGLPLKQRDPVRYYIGIAKERSAKALNAQGLVASGKVWARKGKIVRVADRSHQLNVFRYILNHAREGAAVWSFRDGAPGEEP